MYFPHLGWCNARPGRGRVVVVFRGRRMARKPGAPSPRVYLVMVWSALCRPFASPRDLSCRSQECYAWVLSIIRCPPGRPSDDSSTPGRKLCPSSAAGTPQRCSINLSLIIRGLGDDPARALRSGCTYFISCWLLQGTKARVCTQDSTNLERACEVRR